MLSVEDIMTREPYTLGPDNTLLDAAQIMREHHIRHVPVVSSDEAVIGIVSHPAIIKQRLINIFNFICLSLHSLLDCLKILH